MTYKKQNLSVHNKNLYSLLQLSSKKLGTTVSNTHFSLQSEIAKPNFLVGATLKLSKSPTITVLTIVRPKKSHCTRFFFSQISQKFNSMLSVMTHIHTHTHTLGRTYKRASKTTYITKTLQKQKRKKSHSRFSRKFWTWTCAQFFCDTLPVHEPCERIYQNFLLTETELLPRNLTTSIFWQIQNFLKRGHLPLLKGGAELARFGLISRY